VPWKIKPNFQRDNVEISNSGYGVGVMVITAGQETLRVVRIDCEKREKGKGFAPIFGKSFAERRV
jgi:hypothetical protein